MIGFEEARELVSTWGEGGCGPEADDALSERHEEEYTDHYIRWQVEND